jgi:hypothetical protein
MAFDVNGLINGVLSTGKSILGKDLPAMGGFSHQQLEGIAKQAKLIAEGTVDGSIDAQMRKEFLEDLAELTRSFINTLAGLAVVTAEKLWNGIVGVIWGAIGAATGLHLTPPSR